MTQSGARLHDPGSPAQGLGSVERKLKDEIRVGEYLEAVTPKVGQPTLELDASSRLAGYARTIDHNVSRVFLVRGGRHAGIVYRNNTDGSLLLLDMDYF